MAEARTILVVEDNEKNLKLVRDVLRFHGYRTIEAGTGQEAVELAGAHRPDLILMDLQLPDMDGVSALARIRALEGGTSIPAVAVTAFAMKGEAERVAAAGFDGYLSKPIDVRAFPEQVRGFCDGGRR
jgi:two-component system, cell cycle response regulator DivK